MELGSIGLGLLREGAAGWPVPEAIVFWIPPAGDPRSATKNKNKNKNHHHHHTHAEKQTKQKIQIAFVSIK